ncbi:MAG: hypothetical protein CM15mP47_2790 [Methanobacteriota archaeon]|nr:MAG: hypothetical protein CM15mP47_2790 [Euryarchaeota archaeon]
MTKLVCEFRFDDKHSSFLIITVGVFMLARRREYLTLEQKQLQEFSLEVSYCPHLYPTIEIP